MDAKAVHLMLVSSAFPHGKTQVQSRASCRALLTLRPPQCSDQVALASAAGGMVCELHLDANLFCMAERPSHMPADLALLVFTLNCI